MFGSNRTQQSTEDRPVLIDGHTGKVITDDRVDDRDTGRGQGRQEYGSAKFIYDRDTGRATPYRDGDEF